MNYVGDKKKKKKKKKYVFMTPLPDRFFPDFDYCCPHCVCVCVCVGGGGGGGGGSACVFDPGLVI